MITDLKDALMHLDLVSKQTQLLELAQQVLENDALQSKNCLKAQLIVENYLSVAQMHHEEIGVCLRRVAKLS